CPHPTPAVHGPDPSRPTACEVQPSLVFNHDLAGFRRRLFPLQSHAKSRHFPSSELYEQREFAGLVAEWSALTHSNSLIGRLPPATIGTWLNTAGAPGRGMSGPPIESLTRSKMTSLAWSIRGSRPRMAAIPSWVPVRCLSGDLGDCKRQPKKQGRETKTASVTSATTSVGLGLNLNFDYDVGNRNREPGVSFSQASRFFWDQLRIPQGGTECVLVLASATWRGRGRVCMATRHEPTAGRSRHCCQSRVESDSCSADGGQWLFSEYRSGPSGGR
ncbi:hypothetical protein CPAR01_15364, partial [Colletotrichum paranaense]